jgi:O-antigen/teichoic acid export membrane protein
MDKKYTGDVAWTGGSFVIQVIAGALINFSILYFLNAEALGVFNQIYAIYAIVGQLTVFGIHDSVLKHVAEFADNEASLADFRSSELLNTISVAGVMCGMGLGLMGALILGGLSSIAGEVFDSRFISVGTLYLAPGIFLFVTNKVLISVLNGQRQMKFFALASGIRVLGILSLVLLVIFFYPQYENFGLAFTLAEVPVFMIIFALRPFRLCAKASLLKKWILRHLHFGVRSSIHSIVAEAFIRVDVLMLGVFMSDRAVGIYSFAAFFAEGIYQLPIVVRNMNNPILVKLLIEKNTEKFVAFTRKTGMLSLGITTVVAATTAAIYPMLDVAFEPEVIRESTMVLWVLLSGMVFYSLFVPFDFLFLIGGRPGTQSLFMLGNLSFNVLLNALLIPELGLLGACVASVASFAFAAFMLNTLATLVLGLPRGLFFDRKFVC